MNNPNTHTRIIEALINGELAPLEANKHLVCTDMDALRASCSPAHAPALARLIADTSAAPECRTLALSLSRELMDDALVRAAQSLAADAPTMEGHITAVLFLASKGQLNSDEWRAHLDAFKRHQEDFLAINMRFYRAEDALGLRSSVERRIAGGRHGYNRPLYDLILDMTA